MNDIRKKLFNLRKYKVYDYSVFDSSIPREKIEVFMSRAAKKGLIEKIGKGKFFKRDQKIPFRRVERINAPRDRSALRYGKIKPSKYRIFKNLFWSNRNIPIDLASYIARVLQEDIMSDVMYLRYFFGDRKVIEVYLNNFYPQNRKKYVERILGV